MKCKVFHIYTLSCPKSGEIRYVGQTRQRPQSRYASHISSSKHNQKKDYTHCWIKSLLNDGLKPIMEIIEDATTIDREIYWIKYYRESGYNLTNYSDGGELGNFGKTWKMPDWRVATYKYNNNKPLIQLSLHGDFIREWESSREFCRHYNIGISTASVCILKKILCNGFIVMYKNDPYDISLVKIPKRVLVFDIKNNTKNIFKNSTEAAKSIKCDNSTVCKAAKNGNKVYKQFKIYYI